MADLEKLFSTKKPIIGMIHLAGKDFQDRVRRGIDEMLLYDSQRVDGVIIEDYHGGEEELLEVLEQSSHSSLRIIRGINFLKDPYSSFELANRFGARFIQFDSVQTQSLDLRRYRLLRRNYPEIVVLGGVEFKYQQPINNPLAQELEEAKSRCDAIVTTGSGTGVETPIEKLRTYKRLLESFFLFIGAGVDISNVREQLAVADGAIIGSYFKPKKNTNLPIDKQKIKALMEVVKQLRE